MREVMDCIMESEDGGKTWKVTEVKDVRDIDGDKERIHVSRPLPYQGLELKAID
jgi:hypothetical protein